MDRIPIYPGLAGLAERYDGFLLDSWGVLQDGVAAFDAANRCLVELRRCDKRIVILSNSARRASVVATELAQIGVAMGCIDNVLTGGESAWRVLKDDRAAAAGVCYYLGSRRSRSLLDGLDLRLTASVGEATFILNTAPPDDLSDDELNDVLHLAATRDLPMVCANPDLVAHHGAELRACAGDVAARYEKLGGPVRYHGKPHGAFYDEALDLLSPIPVRRILAVGDSLRTDVAGAEAAGIDALFVAGGIHRDDLSKPETLPETLAELCRRRNVRPIGVLASFAW